MIIENIQRVFVDFHNSDKEGRVRLNTIGTIRDLNRFGIILKPGLELWFDDEEGNVAKGTVEFSKEEYMWVGIVNWADLKKK